MKSFSTEIFNQVSPIGFDFEIYLIQLQLQRITWLEGCFGVAHRQKRVLSEPGTKEKSIWYPQGFKNKVGVASTVIDQDLSFDDSYASRIFFLMKDADINPPSDRYDWVQLGITIGQKTSLIFHCNLSALEIPNSEQVKTDILYILNNCSKVSGIEFCEDMNEVWKEFDLTLGINGVTRYPNYCLRIDMTITYPAFPVNGGFGYDPATGIATRFPLGWIYCPMQILVVAVVNPANTQTLENGDVIPVEYLLNVDNTVTVPYLTSYTGISVLSRFMLNNDYYQGTFFVNGNINVAPYGPLGVGDTMNFDINVAIWGS